MALIIAYDFILEYMIINSNRFRNDDSNKYENIQYCTNLFDSIPYKHPNAPIIICVMNCKSTMFLENGTN